MSRARDSQRSKVYAAEKSIPSGRALLTVENAQGVLDHLYASAWFRRRWQTPPAEIRPGFGHRRAVSYPPNRHTQDGTVYRHPTIELPLWARTELVLLHEIAHQIVSNRTRWLAGSVLDSEDPETSARWADDLTASPVVSCSHGHKYTRIHREAMAAHGRLFAATMLDLVGYQMGADAKRALREAFRAHKVRYTRRRAPMSPEQREAAAARLSAARERN